MNIWDEDNYQFLFILIISAFLIYVSGPQISRIGHVFLLLAAYKSNKNYIWIAFLFVLYDTPNYFYFGGTADDPVRVPIYSLGKNLSLTFQDLLMFILLIKSFAKRFKLTKGFRNIFIGLVVFITFYLIMSVFLGTKSTNMTWTVRYLLPLLYIMIIPKLISSKMDWINLFKILFPIVLFAFIGQIYFIINREPLSSLIYPAMIEKVNLNVRYYAMGAEVSRFYTGVYIGFISLCSALYFLNSKKIKINKLYLNLIVLLVLMQAVFSATRSYSIAFSIILFGWMVKQKMRQLPRFVLAMVIMMLISYQFLRKSEVVDQQMDRSFERLMTVQELARGDITAGGTYGRLSQRTPRVMKKYWESPLLGYGFSDEYYKYADDHVAIPNLLLNFGIVGFVYLHILLITITLKILRLRKTRRLSIENYLFLLGLIAIFLVHLLGRQMFGLTLAPVLQMFIVLYFSFWLCFTKNPINDDSVAILVK